MFLVGQAESKTELFGIKDAEVQITEQEFDPEFRTDADSFDHDASTTETRGNNYID